MDEPEWVTYRRLTDRPVEAMRAHFRQHTYHRHSHKTYSFGLTESGAQAFGCRGSQRTSAAGPVGVGRGRGSACHSDGVQPGRAARRAHRHRARFTYRIVHIGPSLVADVLSDKAGRAAGLPLFTDPVLIDPVLASAVGRLHRSLLGDASALARDEALAAAVAALVDRGARRVPAAPVRDDSAVAHRVRALLEESYVDDLGAEDLAVAAGCSRFAVHRAFKRHYGFAASDYQRQLRLRHARRLIAEGHPVAEAAVLAGFTDQAHLTRWFRRCYGITPGTYARG